MVKLTFEETPQRRSKGGAVRDAALILCAFLPCAAIWGLSWMHMAAQEIPHQTLQAMVANERVLFTATDLTDQIQRERAAVVLATVKSPWVVLPGRLQDQYQQTDNTISAFQQALFDTTLDGDSVAAALAATATLKQIRKEASQAKPDAWRESFTAYSNVVDAVLRVCQATRVSKTDRGVGKHFVKIVLLQDAREAASRLETLLAVHGATGQPLAGGEVLEVARYWAAASDLLQVAISGLGKGSEALAKKLRQSQEWKSVQKVAEDVILHQPDAAHRVAGAERVAYASTITSGILVIERGEGDAVHEQITACYRLDKSQNVAMHGWVVFALLFQLIVIALCMSGIIARRHLTRTNNLLAEQRSDLNAALCATQEATITADAGGLIVRMNATAESLTGWSSAEAIGRPLSEVFCCLDPKTYEPILSPEGTNLEDNAIVASRSRVVLLSRDGAEYQIACSTATITRADEGIRGIIYVFRDITADYRIREKLQESEALYREMVENLPMGVVIIDPRTRVIEGINPYAAAMFGLPKDQIIGHQCHAFLCPAQRGACPVCDLHQPVDNSERIMLRANGDRIPILKSVRRIRLRDREQLLECFLNISAYKQVQDDLRRTKQDLEQHATALRFASHALGTTVQQQDANFSI